MAAKQPARASPELRGLRQIVRNIQSHHEAEGNAIAEGLLKHVPRVGYQVTKAGRAHIA